MSYAYATLKKYCPNCTRKKETLDGIVEFNIKEDCNCENGYIIVRLRANIENDTENKFQEIELKNEDYKIKLLLDKQSENNIVTVTKIIGVNGINICSLKVGVEQSYDNPKRRPMDRFERAVHISEVGTYCNLKYGTTHNNKYKDMYDMYSSYCDIFDKWLNMVHDFNEGLIEVNEDHVGYIYEWLNAEENQDFIKEMIMKTPEHYKHLT